MTCNVYPHDFGKRANIWVVTSVTAGPFLQDSTTYNKNMAPPLMQQNSKYEGWNC